jgi:NAD dependent epimerase/dehydratase family enzyme
MKTIILGGTGMLGHRLWVNLRAAHEVSVTVRAVRDPFPTLPEFPSVLIK